jgi:hypothetical protein
MSTQIICMVKNEQLLIKKFIEYHISIVDNITIIDNGSCDDTVNIAKKYNIDLIQTTKHFKYKNFIIGNFIRASNYDIIIPMDVDEFIVYDDGNIICSNTNTIREYFDKLIKINFSLFKINKIYNYIPDTANSFSIEKNKWRSKKYFVKQNKFISTCPGFHNMKMSENNRLNSCISYLHFHYINFDRWYDSSKQKMIARLGDKWNDIEALKIYRGYSNHIAKELLHYYSTGLWHSLSKEIEIKLIDSLSELVNSSSKKFGSYTSTSAKKYENK